MAAVMPHTVAAEEDRQVAHIAVVVPHKEILRLLELD
jgi:hypothetical protein